MKKPDRYYWTDARGGLLGKKAARRMRATYKGQLDTECTSRRPRFPQTMEREGPPHRIINATCLAILLGRAAVMAVQRGLTVQRGDISLLSYYHHYGAPHKYLEMSSCAFICV